MGHGLFLDRRGPLGFGPSVPFRPFSLQICRTLFLDGGKSKISKVSIFALTKCLYQLVQANKDVGLFGESVEVLQRNPYLEHKASCQHNSTVQH